jgi:hypothetical protein
MQVAVEVVLILVIPLEQVAQEVEVLVQLQLVVLLVLQT